MATNLSLSNHKINYTEASPSGAMSLLYPLEISAVPQIKIPYATPDPEARNDILNPWNKTIPDIEYCGDIFEKQKETSENLYTASDGKQYDLKSVLLDRIESVAWEYKYSQPDKNIFSRAFNFLKEKFGIGVTFNKMVDIKLKHIELIASDTDINEIFYQITGLDYTKDNIEAFLKGEIRLTLENMAEQFIGGPINIPPSAPYISKYYTDTKTHKNLQQARSEMTHDEIQKYKEINDILDTDYQIKLENALMHGQLLLDKAEDGSTVLDNLYKIATAKRADNLNNKQLTEECIEILNNPYIVTQIAENIPKEYQDACTDLMVAHELKKQNSKQLAFNRSISNESTLREQINKEKEKIFEYRYLGTCAAASLEFDMVLNNPTEFFRMIEGLSSKNKVFNKKVTLGEKSLSLLDKYRLPYELNNEDCIVSITADDNAYFLAEIQTKYKDENERSIVDILAQSAIMNLGSRQTYESIRDYREPNECSIENSGLVKEEISFVRDILFGNKNFDNVYKSVSDKGIVKNLYDNKNIRNELLKALEKNGSVVAGIVFTDKNNVCRGGHEITIIGYTTNLCGNGCFIIQDSDDWLSQPVAVPEEKLLSQVHHAFI